MTQSFPVVRRALVRLYPPLLLLGLWQGLCLTGWFSASVLIPPAAVWACFWDLAESGDLGDAIGASGQRVLLGFLLGSVTGLGVGLALGLSRSLDAAFGWLLQAIRQIPPIAWVPLLILCTGIEENFKITLIAFSVFFPVALNALDGVRSVPSGWRELARLYRFNRFALLRRVILPAAFPAIVTGLRLGLSRAWMVVVAAELFASSVGIGHLMDWGRELFQLDIVMVCIIVIGVIGFILDTGLRWVEQQCFAIRIRPSRGGL